MISDEKLKEIENEVDNFDLNMGVMEEAINHTSSARINGLIETVSNLVNKILLFAIAIKLGGTLGLVLLGSMVVSLFATGLKKYSEYKAKKEIMKEYSRFMDQLREKGIYDDRRKND